MIRIVIHPFPLSLIFLLCAEIMAIKIIEKKFMQHNNFNPNNILSRQGVHSPASPLHPFPPTVVTQKGSERKYFDVVHKSLSCFNILHFDLCATFEDAVSTLYGWMKLN
jgi:hypothetical protein